MVLYSVIALVVAIVGGLMINSSIRLIDYDVNIFTYVFKNPTAKVIIGTIMVWGAMLFVVGVMIYAFLK